jgi:hypothetical protein
VTVDLDVETGGDVKGWIMMARGEMEWRDDMDAVE